MATKTSDIVSGVRRALDDSVATLDAATQERLQDARRRALDALPPQKATEQLVPTRWVPAFAFAATLAIAVGVWQRVGTPPVAPSGMQTEDRLDAQEVDLMENLDFAAWMVVEGDSGEPG